MRVNSNRLFNSINWSYPYDADAIFQFRILNRILDVISIPNPSKDSLIIINFEYFTLMEKVCESEFILVVLFT